MMQNFLDKVFGSANDRYVKNIINKEVKAINALEPSYAAMTDEVLAGQTEILRNRLAQGEILDDILPQAFAVVREASKRLTGMRHFDVQLVGGYILHKGMIAEMKTGEGKTLMSTLAVYLNALAGRGVHVVTVNDYLAKRDAKDMGHIFSFLGLTTGCIVPGLNDSERKAAYACDVTYATNNELGFDYLRDHMKYHLDHCVQRGHAFAIVDEVDSILIDEARTPLIISGPAEDSSELYVKINQVIPGLQAGDYDIDEKGRSALFTDQGIETVEKKLKSLGLLKQGSLFETQNINTLHHLLAALKAHKLYHREKDYMVKDGEVVIIDEFTGRALSGRRYSDGLHQALEAKEGVLVQQENQTLASITFQNYFRLYDKLSGMTGTAKTEAEEFSSIYKLDVVSIPTHVPVIRKDQEDEIYKSAREKYEAIIKQIRVCHEKKQPVLVGTVSIERSEYLSSLLKKENLPHHVLNARQHEKEAHIIATAGLPGGITIATNMAGRGTDIQLGGNYHMALADLPVEQAQDPEVQAALKAEIAAQRDVVLKAGGLYVLGTERHESRRIDNQLRGRSGRQGDPGESKFFLSLEDDLMRIFGGDRMEKMLERFGFKEGEVLTHKWMTKAVEKAQIRVEARNFEIRKNLLKFDDVMNEQRHLIYDQRKAVMTEDSIKDYVKSLRDDVIDDLVQEHERSDEQNYSRLQDSIKHIFALDLTLPALKGQALVDYIMTEVDAMMYAKEKRFGTDLMRMAEKSVVLQKIDQLWKEHLAILANLREGIGLRAYGQRDPLSEFKREAFELFGLLIENIKRDVSQILSIMEVNEQAVRESLADEPEAEDQDLQQNLGAELIDNPYAGQKIQRNALCPCGSGKKYKHCHGQAH